MNQADKDAEQWMAMNQKAQYREMIRAKESGDSYYINQHGDTVIEKKPMKTSADIAKDHLIVWAQSVDAQLWNDRVNALITALEEFERQVNESKTSKG